MANGSPQGPTIVVPGAGWVDVASRAITQVGFPVVIAGVLLWFVLGKFQSNMESIVTHMNQNTQTAAQLIETAQAEIEELQHQTSHLSKQSEYMGKVVEAGEQLIQLHQQELAELKSIRERRQ